jgi:hypothetical protein
MKQEAETMSENGKTQLRRKIVYSKELTALEKRYLLELMMTKQTESNSESGWIPCSERMPNEPGTHVMVTDGVHIMESWYEVIDGELLWVDNYTMYVNINFGEVTHWMPLPEPPNKDNQQEG